MLENIEIRQVITDRTYQGDPMLMRIGGHNHLTPVSHLEMRKKIDGKWTEWKGIPTIDLHRQRQKAEEAARTKRHNKEIVDALENIGKDELDMLKEGLELLRSRRT